MRAHDGGVEHLKEMRRGAHGRERVEERLEDAGPAQAIEASPHAVPGTEALRQSAPANVLDGEEMKRLEEAAIVFGLPSAPRQSGPRASLADSLKGHGNGADSSLTGGADVLGSLSCLWPDCAYLLAS
jgi:hypothetical protein